MMLRRLLVLHLVQYEPESFNEQEWRDTFKGMEAYTTDATHHDYLNRHSRNMLYNPDLQRDELGNYPDTLFLLTPIWGDENETDPQTELT